MKLSTTTCLLHADRLNGAEYGSVHQPIHVGATYGYPTAEELVSVFQGNSQGFVYSRQGTPTGAALEKKLTMLEGGQATAVFSTGMGAISAMFMALLKAGDHIVVSRFLFGNTVSLLDTLQDLGVSVSYVDSTNASNVEMSLRPNTKMVFVETIANPCTQVSDLHGIGALCSERNILYVVDSTMTTPLLLRARDVQAGLVVHSLTKGISGHGNAMGGAVIDTGLFDWRTYINISDSYRKGDPKNWGITQIRKKGIRNMGATLRGEDAHRIAAGAETLALRIPRVCDNALQLAKWLSSQPGVAKVHYPGLHEHSEHERALSLFGGYFGCLLSIELQEGLDEMAFLNALQFVVLSTHLADNRTMALPVSRTIFWEMGRERRAMMGIAEGLIRISVGIEDIHDLYSDFDQAFSTLRGA